MMRGRQRRNGVALFVLFLGLSFGRSVAQSLDTAQPTGGSPIVARIARSGSSCWILTRDRDDPALPGLWQRGSGPDCKNPQPAGVSVASHAYAPLVIRAGDRVIVEDHSPMVDARLQAIALQSAHAGESLRARLVAGGGMVRVLAEGPGQAVLAPQEGLRP